MSRSKSLNDRLLSACRAGYSRTFEQDFCLWLLASIHESAQRVSVEIAPEASDVCMPGMALFQDALLVLCPDQKLTGGLGLEEIFPRTMSCFVWCLGPLGMGATVMGSAALKLESCGQAGGGREEWAIFTVSFLRISL